MFQENHDDSNGDKMPVVNILLEGAQYSFDLFAEQFQKTWQYSVSPYRDGRLFGIIVEGMIVGCALVPSQVADQALLQSARDSVLWPDAEAAVARHNAHLIVALAREKDPVSSHILFSKVICSLLHQRNVVGVYLRPGLFEPAYYIKCADGLLEGKLPTELWVDINALGFDKDEGYTFFTNGMHKFGKMEFEILESKNNFIDTYYLLKELVKHTIANDVTYKNGDTVGAKDGVKNALSISKGVKIKGTTIKIDI